jgi:hypothetical protein
MLESFTTNPMNHKIIDGLLVCKPTRVDIESLKVGDFAPNCFGNFAKITEIYARGNNIHNKAYICYYVEWHGTDSSISESIEEGEIVPTLPLCSKYIRSENFPQIN